MSEKLDHVADALIANFKQVVAEHSGQSFEETNVSVPARAIWLRMAVVAVEAMIEPTAAMIEAGRYCDDGEGMNIGPSYAEEVWRVMAAEALK
jgi:hypothetical protein